MSDNDYDSNEPIGEFFFVEERNGPMFDRNSFADDEDDDVGYDPYDDPFQDDNNNNCTTTMIDNDPEHFEYRVTDFVEMEKRLEATAFPSAASPSYAQSSSTPATCSICWKSQNQFESLICQHTFCCDCWSQYIETNFQTSRTIRKSSTKRRAAHRRERNFL